MSEQNFEFYNPISDTKRNQMTQENRKKRKNLLTPLPISPWSSKVARSSTREKNSTQTFYSTHRDELWPRPRTRFRTGRQCRTGLGMPPVKKLADTFLLVAMATRDGQCNSRLPFSGSRMGLAEKVADCGASADGDKFSGSKGSSQTIPKDSSQK